MKVFFILLLLISQTCFGQVSGSTSNVSCLVMHGPGERCDYYSRIMLGDTLGMINDFIGRSYTNSIVFISPDSVYKLTPRFYTSDTVVLYSDGGGDYGYSDKLLALDTIPEFKPGPYIKGDTVKVTAKNSLFVADRTFNAISIPSENAYWNYIGPIPVNPNALTLEKLDARLKIIEAKVNAIPPVDTIIPPVNAPPVARAGSDQTITLPANAVLNGSLSSDADGSITSYKWSIGSTTLSNSSIVTIQFSGPGSFTYTLTVTDNRGATATDNTTITVNPAPVTPPPTGTTTSFTVPVIPASEYINRPGAGAEQWHNGSAAVGTLPQPLDVYYRFSWNQIEKGQGVYDWSYLDGLIRTAINRGQKLSFGIMANRAENGDGAIVYDGATSYYPQYLHNLMKAETSKDFVYSGYWVPNYNSPNWIGRLTALNQAVRDHLIFTRYTPTSGPNAGKSVLLGDAIYCIDIRGFGQWGEWHTANAMPAFNSFPSVPTSASLKAIIDAHTKTFDRWPLVIMVAALDAGSSQFPVFHPYLDVAYYALTTSNAWGPIGFRKDQWASKEQYLIKITELNSKSYNGIALRSLIMNKSKQAPVTGEPMPGTGADLSDLVRQIKIHGATSFGNGNYGATPSSSQAAYVVEAANAAGYRIQVKDGSITTGTNGQIKITWENVGLSPTYENWNTVLELKNGSTVIWSGNSSFKAKLFLPGSTTVTDVFPNIPGGNYSLTVKLVDPTGYRDPLVLANRGRNADGSYTLKP